MSVRATSLCLAAALALTACGSDSVVVPPPPGTPTQLGIVTQPSSAAQSGAALAVPPLVRLMGSDGKTAAVPGVLVTATTGVGAALTNATAMTDGNGTARFSGLIVTGLVGSYTLHFTSGPLTPVDAAALTLAAGAPTRLGLAIQPSVAATAGVALVLQPSIQLRDASGNAVSRAGVVVSAIAVSGTAALSDATATTNAAGVALFSGLTVAGATGPYTLRFTATGFTSVDAAAPTVLAAGPATQLALLTQPPAGAPSGATLPTQPVVQLRDAFGNNVTQAGAKVAATLVNPLGGSVVANDTAVSDATGKATFAGLRISGPVGNYTFRFTSAGYSSVVASAALALGAGAPAFIVLSTQPPATAVNAQPLGTQPAVVVTDSSANRVSQAGIVVTATVSSGPANTLTNATATTDATGKATFSGLTLTGQGGPYRFTFTAPSFPDVLAAGNLQLLAGSPTHLAVQLGRQPSANAVNGAAFALQPFIELHDVSENVSLQSGFVITATLTGANSGNAVVGGGTMTTAATGVAAFTNLSLTGLAVLGAGTSYTLRFSATNLGFVDAAAPTNLFPGTATKLFLTTQPAATATSGAALAPQPVVQLQDASGNATATPTGVQITAGVISGSVAITGGVVNTAAGTGAATFTVLTLTGSPGTFTLVFSSGGLGSVTAAQTTVLN